VRNFGTRGRRQILSRCDIDNQCAHNARSLSSGVCLCAGTTDSTQIDTAFIDSKQLVAQPTAELDAFISRLPPLPTVLKPADALQALGVDPRPRCGPWEEYVPSKFLLTPREVALTAVVNEPIFYTAALWNIRSAKRASQTFHFDANDAGVIGLLGAHYQVSHAHVLNSALTRRPRLTRCRAHRVLRLPRRSAVATSCSCWRPTTCRLVIWSRQSRDSPKQRFRDAHARVGVTCSLVDCAEGQREGQTSRGDRRGVCAWWSTSTGTNMTYSSS
jgi:hypothetical protein